MIKKIIFFLVLILVLFLNKKFYYQKWLGHERIPETFIMDEHDYPVVGYTFRRTGIPTGWSNMNIYKILDDQKPNLSVGYQNLSITVDNQIPSLKNLKNFNYPLTHSLDVDLGKGTETIRVVQPFLDHPPLGSLIFSLNIDDPKNFDDISIPQIRSISLAAASLTAILLFIYSYLLYHNLLTSFFSFIIYSTVTTYIIISRFALFENLIIPFYLLSHILLLLGLKQKNLTEKIFYFTSGILIGLTYLVKEIGIFTLFSAIAILIHHRKTFSKILLVVAPFLFIVGSYYLYSLYLSPTLTIKLLFDQTERNFFGSLNFLFTLIQPRVRDMPLEGYWIWGFISVFSLSKKVKTHFHLLAGFISFLCLFVIMAGNNYPWYIFPIMPFLIISSANLLTRLCLHPSLINLLLFFFLPLSSSLHWGYLAYHPQQNLANLYRLLFAGLISVYTFYRLNHKKYPILKIIWIIFFGIILWQINKWNQKGFIYLISNWGQLPPYLTLPVQ